MALYKGETLIVDEFIKDPIPENSAIFFNHYGRYFYAMKTLGIAENDCIVDGSCGNGYGSYGLSFRAKHVYGLDINDTYLELARNNFKKDNLTFCTYNEFYNTEIKLDKIISIETFEHVPKENNIEFVKDLVSCLKENGSMFTTVPLGNNEPSSYNKWHLFEPDISYIYNLFSKYFKSINIEIDKFVNCFNQECQYAYLILKNKKA
jgi:cyclopropane fatty-acyl-phospholipid synthase-like methyltransferase